MLIWMDKMLMLIWEVKGVDWKDSAPACSLQRHLHMAPISWQPSPARWEEKWLLNVATCADGRGGEVQEALWEKASGLRQTPPRHRNPQRSPTRSGRKYRFISQEVLSRTYLVDLGANLLHLAGVTRDSVEPISLEEVLLRFKLLNRFPNKRRDLDGLIGCYLVLGECFLSS